MAVGPRPLGNMWVSNFVGVQTRRYEVEGTGGYYDEYSELRAHIVCINRRKGWIHTLLNLLKISRCFLKSHFLNTILQ